MKLSLYFYNFSQFLQEYDFEKLCRFIKDRVSVCVCVFDFSVIFHFLSLQHIRIHCSSFP